MSTSAQKKLARVALLSTMMASILAPVALAQQSTAADSLDASVFDLSLEELLQLEIIPSTTLTVTDLRHSPAASTIISQEMLVSSGARSLDEALEIYVPNMQFMRNHHGAAAMGVRTILSSTNNKVLLLVNGRVINHRLQQGAFSERDLPTLGDIHHIDVIRGPGSAVYGPGAVAGVINIITQSHQTFTGLDTTIRLGGRWMVRCRYIGALTERKIKPPITTTL